MCARRLLPLFFRLVPPEEQVLIMYKKTMNIFWQVFKHALSIFVVVVVVDFGRFIFIFFVAAFFSGTVLIFPTHFVFSAVASAVAIVIVHRYHRASPLFFIRRHCHAMACAVHK